MWRASGGRVTRDGRLPGSNPGPAAIPHGARAGGTSLIYHPRIRFDRMKPGLSDSDWQRIKRFSETSRYDRTPEILLPGDEEEEE